MITAWMIYVLVVSALVGGGALLVETLLRPHRLPTRWVWGGALLLSVVWPVAHALWPSAPLDLPEVAPPPPPAGLLLMPPVVQVPSESVLRRLDGPLLALWILGSGALLVFFFGLILRARRLRKRWRKGTVGDDPVLFSDRWGPAVVGFLRPEVVLPAWCRDLDASTLRLVLEHEMEHLRAGDLRLILAAAVLLIALPWNLPVWWQVNRMKIAVEADCDLRVLRRHRGRARPYLELLLEVGRRSSRHQPLAAMLSEPGATLSRRIRTMTMPIPQRPWVRGILLAGAGGVLVALACWTPEPTDSQEEANTLLEPVVVGAPSVGSLFEDAYRDGIEVKDWPYAIETLRSAQGADAPEMTRQQVDFWLAYSIFRAASHEQRPQTVATARAALPRFQEVLRLLEGSGAYAQENGLEKNMLDIAQATRTYIEIQEAIIRRGR